MSTSYSPWINSGAFLYQTNKMPFIRYYSANVEKKKKNPKKTTVSQYT